MGGKTTIDVPKPDYTPMLKIIEQMKADQAAAAQQSALAQERALGQSQDTAAQAGMQQANTAAMQDLMRQQQYQQAMDASAKQKQLAQTAAMGKDVVGPAFDVNAANAARLQSLSGMAGSIPATQANYAGFGPDILNQLTPAKQSARLNKFSLPDSTGLQLS